MSVSVDGGLSPILGNIRVDTILGTVTSNLDYIVPLEYGHSTQAPVGMVGAFEPEYLQLLAGEVQYAIQGGTSDLGVSLTMAVTGATLGVMRAIADRTPVDTGRAKSSWVAQLPDGTTQSPASTLTAHEGHAAAAGLAPDLAGARARATAHHQAIAARQVRIAESKARTYEARLGRQREARAAAAYWRRVASLL